MQIGDVIKAERNRRGWSIDVLVEQIGDVKGGDRASLSKIENNQRWPRPDTLSAIARAFGMRVYQLFALAEGIRLPISKATREEMLIINRYRVMEPEAQYHLTAVATALAKEENDES